MHSRAFPELSRSDGMIKHIGASLLWLAFCLPAVSQNAAQPPANKVYSGNFGAGFTMTSGNADTRNFNLSFEFNRDPKTKNVIRAKGLYLRSTANGDAIADLLRLAFRDEYALSKRVSVYGALGYLRDPFKDISYLINPQGGLAFRVYDSDRTAFGVSGGGGAVWEKDLGFDVATSGTLNAGQSFSYKLSDTAKITQNLTGLWKTSNFSDALYHFDLALVTAIVKKADLKFEFMDDYKNVTPNASIKKNDVALIISFLYKF
jgi:putative salt-induced outer membrane protein